VLYQLRVQTTEATQITAENGAEIAELVGGELQGDGSIVVVHPELDGWSEQFGIGWFVTSSIDDRGLTRWTGYSPDVWASMWQPAPDGPPLTLGFGQAAAVGGQLAVGAFRDVDVPLSRTMPDGYTATATLVGSGGLASIAPVLAGTKIDGIVGRAPKSVRVRIRNTGLSAIITDNVIVNVIATALR
jgi:hypothetical protein